MRGLNKKLLACFVVVMLAILSLQVVSAAQIHNAAASGTITGIIAIQHELGWEGGTGIIRV